MTSERKNHACILDVDSPSYPPEPDEYWQCGCRACIQHIIDALPTKEPPLLQCIDCRNTESPAGAMARQFNHGRCAHCGGYFKVVRA